MRAFPVTEFKLAKFATKLSATMKTTQSIRAYCVTVCEQNELRGFNPVRKGVRFYKIMSGIRHKLRHRVKKAQPLTPELLTRMQKVVKFFGTEGNGDLDLSTNGFPRSLEKE